MYYLKWRAKFNIVSVFMLNCFCFNIIINGLCKVPHVLKLKIETLHMLKKEINTDKRITVYCKYRITYGIFLSSNHREPNHIHVI